MTTAMTVPDGSRWATAVASIGATVSLAEFEATGRGCAGGPQVRRGSPSRPARRPPAHRAGLRVLEIDDARLFGYDSLYFDTADHQPCAARDGRIASRCGAATEPGAASEVKTVNAVATR